MRTDIEWFGSKTELEVFEELEELLGKTKGGGLPNAETFSYFDTELEFQPA